MPLQREHGLLRFVRRRRRHLLRVRDIRDITLRGLLARAGFLALPLRVALRVRLEMEG